MFQAVPPPPYWPSPTASAAFINVQPNFPVCLNPTKPAATAAAVTPPAPRDELYKDSSSRKTDSQ